MNTLSTRYVSAADHKMYNKVTLTMSYTEKLNLQPTLRLKTPCRRSWSVLIAFASASTNDVANAPVTPRAITLLDYPAFWPLRSPPTKSFSLTRES